MHCHPILARFDSKAVLRNEVPRPHEKGEADREEREPVLPVRPAFGAAVADAREVAVLVEVVAIALTAEHAAVAFSGRALYGQSAERWLDACLVVGALVQRCSELDRAIHDGCEPVVVENLRGGGREGEE